MRRLPRRLRPGLITVQIGSVIAAGALLVAFVLGAPALVVQELENVNRENEAARLATAIEQSAAAMELVVGLQSEDSASSRLSPGMTVDIHEVTREQEERARRLSELKPDPSSLRLLELATAENEALRRFFRSGDSADLRALRDIEVAMRPLAKRVAEEEVLKAASDAEALARVLLTVRVALATVVFVVVSLLATATSVISHRMGLMLERSEGERLALASTTAAIERRNDQFRTLYEVSADAGDDLDIDTVATTAVQAARRLFDADLSVLWLHRDAELEVAASEASDPTTGLKLPLDIALPTRAIARGRSFVLGTSAEADLQDTGVLNATSGVLVPLVVNGGAGGVLGCWSKRGHTFNNDDRRILEMLAGHVAPTIGSVQRLRASEERANTDALTGLHNRRQLTEDILHSHALAIQAGQPLVTAMLDIDRFKDYNDRYGHATGDAALRVVARIVQSWLRPTDGIYRYGGEEFLVVLRGTSIERAPEVMERLRASVELGTRSSAELPAGLTISVGLAGSPEHGREFALLTERADEALYRAKAEGRNRVVVFGTPEESAAAA